LTFAVQPQLSTIDPPGVQRGIETEVVFRGARLEDARQLLLYEPGIEVLSVTPVDGGATKVMLKPAADCRLGFHACRMITETGASDIKMLAIGALPQSPETEPNNEFASPQPIVMDATTYGVIEAEDVDYFVVEAKQGERITAELEGMRLGHSFFDPYLAILNAERFELSRSDDNALLRQDCLCSIVAPADGKYIVQVRESAYGGDGNSKYRLHVGHFPQPLGVIPSGGKPGETLEVTWIGEVTGPRKQQITLPQGTGSSGIFASDDKGIAPSASGVRLGDLPNFVEAEPNNDMATASAGAAPGAMHGIIDKPGESDYFKFSATKGQQYDIRVLARDTLRSPLDPVLIVRNAKGAGVGSNDDTGGPDAYFRFNAPEDGEYTVEAYDHLRGGSEAHAYRIEIAPILPRLTFSLPERERYVAETLKVPRGNRMALYFNVRRDNFGGDLNVLFENLPPGITAELLPLPANRNEIPVLFTAAPDAAPLATLVDVQGKPTDENIKVVGHFAQRSMLIRGQNNTDVYGHDADRLAVTLTKEVPYRVDIVQPKAPLVRNGSMDLKVVTTRAEGFTGPITLAFLYNPPGVGSSGSVNIPEGQNEATIPVTANENAAIGMWKIVVLATAQHAGGRVEVASQMADLEIADRFFNLAVGKTAAEQGKETQLAVTVEKLRDFEGSAKIELVGLPNGATSEPREFNKEATEVVFPIKLTPDAQVGRHTSVLVRAIAQMNGEPVTHTLGPGELRIDAPLPPKVAQPAPPAEEPKPEPVAQTEQPKKPLTRLEQLRQAKEQGGN
jgi:hypothetical protein